MRWHCWLESESRRVSATRCRQDAMYIIHSGQARKFRMECEFQSAPPDEAFASIVDETALRARVLCPWSITRFAAPETLRTSPFVWLLSPAADPLLRAGMQREGGESATGE